jgi:hypothetical protein
MFLHFLRIDRRAGLVLVVLFPVWCRTMLTVVCMAQVNDGQTKVQKAPIKRYFGISACTQCHTQPQDKDIVLCRCTEVTIWNEKDKHKDAYKALLGDRARVMGQLLGYKGEVTKESACLTCHAVDVKDEKLKHSSFRVEDGVTCAVCHGSYVDWVDLHGGLRREEWRTYSRKTKQEQYGMADLWDPAKRARLCMSCHLGSHEEGKVVTHAMYAAGHPPLPSVEIATFSDAMPRHWQYIREKKEEVRKLLKFAPDAARWEQTQLVLASAVIAFRQQMELLAAETRSADESWPEFAQFDCSACHHELKTPSWRQKRGYAGRPGRPQMLQWPTVLVNLSLHFLDESEKEFNDNLLAISRAFDSQPFGDVKAITPAAARAVQWSDSTIAKVANKPIDKAASLRLLRRLCSLAQEGIPDYDSVRQIAWAFRIIFDELNTGGHATPDVAKETQLLLVRLNEAVQLELPSGSKRSIEDQLGKDLKKKSDYDPERFRQIFSELSKKLPANSEGP